MQDADILKLIKKSSVRMIIIGVFILAFGALMLWIFLSGVDSASTSAGGNVAGWIFGGLFILIGLLMLVLGARALTKIKGGKHLLVNALNNNDASYILWYYEHITNVKSGPASNSAHVIWMFGKDKKQYTLQIKKDKVDAMFAYLGAKFPDALVGYSKELETAYEQKLKDARK